MTKAELLGDRANRPQSPQLIEQAIPSMLRAVNRWVDWRWAWDKKRQTWTKLPANPMTGNAASSTDARTWSDFDTAIRMYHAGEADGIGFMLGDGFAGVDLDECLDSTTGVIEPWAAEIISRFPTYAEVSPTGTGVKLFCRGILPEGRRRTGKIELYSEERYFTITGNKLLDSDSEPTDCQQQLEELQREITPEKKTTKPKQPRPETTLDDQQIIDKASSAKNGDKFKRLWSGEFNGTSQSEADLALCNLSAFWTGGDGEQIDRLFRQSGLYREKWDREDYRERTIQRALASTRDYYHMPWQLPERRRRQLSSDESSYGNGKHEPPQQPNDQPQTGAAVILEYFRERWRPVFRRGNIVHCADGDEITQHIVCVPDSKILARLAHSIDAPKDKHGVNVDALPGFFKKWAPVAWGDLRAELPEEINAKSEQTETAKETFRQLVRAVMFQQITLGTTIRGKHGENEVTQTERRTLIGWCRKLAKTGPWRDIRDHNCWCKLEVADDGELRLKVAVRQELCCQVTADKYPRTMPQNTFTRLCERYDVGVSTRHDRPHGVSAVVLERDFIDDLTAGMPDGDEDEDLVEPSGATTTPEADQGFNDSENAASESRK